MAGTRLRHRCDGLAGERAMAFRNSHNSSETVEVPHMRTFFVALAFLALPLTQSNSVAQGGAAGDAAAGKALWDGNATSCKNCHGPAAEGGFGPDLAGRKLSLARVTRAVRQPWGIKIGRAHV